MPLSLLFGQGTELPLMTTFGGPLCRCPGSVPSSLVSKVIQDETASELYVLILYFYVYYLLFLYHNATFVLYHTHGWCNNIFCMLDIQSCFYFRLVPVSGRFWITTIYLANHFYLYYHSSSFFTSFPAWTVWIPLPNLEVILPIVMIMTVTWLAEYHPA